MQPEAWIMMMNDEDFIKRLGTFAPILSRDLVWDNILLAGGSIVDLLINNTKIRDFDFFIYGIETEIEAEKIICRFVKDILDKNQAKIHSITKASGAITVEIQDRIRIYKLQFILRLYKHPSVILHGFDIGCCAIGFDGKKVMMTTLAKYSIERRICIVDLEKRSTSLEARIAKYFTDKNFMIVFQNLNVDTLHNMKKNSKGPCMISIGCLSILCINIIGNQIYGICKVGKTRQEDTSDYDNTVPIMFLNLRFLCKLVQDQKLLQDWYNLCWLQLSDSKELTIIDMTSPIPVDTIFESCEKNLMMFCESFIKDAEGKNSDEKCFDKRLRYITCVPKTKVIEDLEKENWKQCIRDHFTLQIKSIKDLKSKIHDNIKWKKDDPQSQFHGSMKPIVGTAKDWYGEFYTESPIIRPVPKQKRKQVCLEDDMDSAGEKKYYKQTKN